MARARAASRSARRRRTSARDPVDVLARRPAPSGRVGRRDQRLEGQPALDREDARARARRRIRTRRLAEVQVVGQPGVVEVVERLHGHGRSLARRPVARAMLAAVRAVVCSEFAPIDQLRIEERPDPEPGPGQGRGGRAGRGRELRRRAVRAGQVPDQAAAARSRRAARWPATSWPSATASTAWPSATGCWPCRGSAGSPPTSSWPPAASSRSPAR